jgi:hypothetical protein
MWFINQQQVSSINAAGNSVNYIMDQTYTFSSLVPRALAQKFELQMLSVGDYDLLALILHGPMCK